MTRKALEGVRILDFTQVAAGPYSTFLLGFMGAEVIKVESHKRGDSTRGLPKPPVHQLHTYPDGQPGARPWDQRSDYVQRNRNKLSITVDATTPEGKALLIKLAKQSDALMENFRASVIDRWGLSYQDIKAEAPHLVYLKMSSQGNNGPERNYGSLGYTMECLGGLASITGYTPDQPSMTNETYPDPVAGVLGVGALLAGLRYRRKHGTGVFIDLAQREVTTCLLAEAAMDYSMNRRVHRPMGNHHPSMAPHNLYPCQGDDYWVAIAVNGDAQWAALKTALGDPAWARDPRFSESLSRWQHQEEIDAHLAEWTRQRTHYEAMDQLQAQGVPAGAVLKGREAPHNPQLAARDWWDWNLTPEVGRAYAYAGTPWTMSKTDRQPGAPAPRMAEHNRYVFTELLDMTEDEIAALDAKGVIGAEPLWTQSPV